MTPDQYASNIKPVPGSDAIVEFAVRLPGRAGGAPVWLPIDAKFPKEEYERLMDAQEAADAEGARARRGAGQGGGSAGPADRRQYVAPPHHRFRHHVPAHRKPVCRGAAAPGLLDRLHGLRVNVAGPSNLAALLNSLQMGFRTLAIEQRSSEVWQVLRAVKTEFGKFGEALASVKKTLDNASNKIGQTEVRTRAMLRNLKSVEALPEADARLVLGGQSGRMRTTRATPGRRTPAIPLWRRSHPTGVIPSRPAGLVARHTVDILMLAAIRRRYLEHRKHGHR